LRNEFERGKAKQSKAKQSKAKQSKAQHSTAAVNDGCICICHRLRIRGIPQMNPLAATQEKSSFLYTPGDGTPSLHRTSKVPAHGRNVLALASRKRDVGVLSRVPGLSQAFSRNFQNFETFVVLNALIV
jgi:hypothetical protein